MIGYACIELGLFFVEAWSVQTLCEFLLGDERSAYIDDRNVVLLHRSAEPIDCCWEPEDRGELTLPCSLYCATASNANQAF